MKIILEIFLIASALFLYGCIAYVVFFFAKNIYLAIKNKKDLKLKPFILRMAVGAMLGGLFVYGVCNQLRISTIIGLLRDISTQL